MIQTKREVRMELSPLARQRLERIGKLSPAEQQELSDERETEAVLSPFFAGTSNADELWQKVKALSEHRGEEIIRRIQMRLLDTVRLHTGEDDFNRMGEALLALETLKGSRAYSTIEMLLGSIASLRQRYAEMRQQAYEQLRQQVDQQVRAQSDEARRQGLLMDTESTVEASVKSTREWHDFISKHDAAAQEALNDYVSRIEASL
ncbi:MAG TPA: hypothetical protein ENL12_01700 [Dehalococcoidia bacterium]|nr:hypothetical protein [Dehalococcoidia bacterium]